MSSMVGPALRMIVSLGVVLALMYVAARVLRRSQGHGGMGRGGARRPAARQSRRPRQGAAVRARGLTAVAGRVRTGRREAGSAFDRSELQVLARQPLNRTASVAVVRVADRTLLVGFTDTAVQLLTELPADEPNNAEVPLDDDITLSVVEDQPLAQASGFGTSRTPVSVLELLRERTVRRT